MSKKSKFFVILGAGVLIVAGVVAPAILRGQPPGMNAADRELVAQFDADENGWLNNEERKKARTYHLENPATGGFGLFGFGGPPGGGPPGGGPGGRGGGPPGGGPDGGNPLLDLFGLGGPPNGGPGGSGGRGGRGPGGPGGGNRPKASEGVKIEKSSVKPLKNALYDTSVLRTIFIDFENEDWEKEMEDFDGTDVDVPATLTVDGKEYPNCGVHFRGMSSYFMVPAGYKRSLNISMNMADKKQRLLGFKTLNLLNGSSDDSMMSTVLYSKIARQHMPAPRANFVKVVINGEYWGVYTNVEQFNKDFVKANYGSGKGARWKVSGSPRGGGGLDYRGEDPSRYQDPYEQKSGDEEDLAKLIELCRVLDETPADELPAKLEPLVDIDELLWFIALDNGLNNSDGYWIRASDYSIYLDKDDKFHFIPHDMNEAFRATGGPGGPGGGPGGPRGRGRGGRRGGTTPAREAKQSADASSPVDLDPLIGIDDSSKPLRSKVLAVPKYRAKYLRNMRELAQKSLDWKKLGPFVEKQAALIDKAVKDETRKLGTYEAFVAATSAKEADADKAHSAAAGGHGAMNLKEFADARRKYLLKKAAK